MLGVRFLFYLVLLPNFLDFAQATEDNLADIVTLQNGNKLKGISLRSIRSDKPYVEFRGIPYAKAPIGDLRFQPPVSYDDLWGEKPRDATEYGNVCPQLDPFYDPEEEGGSYEELRVLGKEDCLTVNVATPSVSINPEALLPVLVWFHGGNFQSESGSEYGPGKLMDYDIVVVTFNHRLGPLGFLNTMDGKIQGNNGLKDQSLLLQWVQKNIHAFGGSADSVTVAGFNSGAVSIHLHLLSDMSKDLFNRAIIQSGTAIAPWPFMKDPKERVATLAKQLKCGNDTDEATCFSKTDAITIIRKMPRFAEWYIDPLVPMGPSVESDGENMFLAKSAYSILAEGNYWAKDIPVVMGVNSHEGLLHAMDIGYTSMLRRVFNLEWYGAAPISLYYKKSAIDPRSVSEAVRSFYFPLTDDDKINGTYKLVDKDFLFSNMTNLYSDRHFFIPLHHSAKLMGKHNEVYLYWFDYVSDQSIHNLYGYNSSHLFGPSHYDQIQYMFTSSIYQPTTDEDHIKFEKYFLSGLYKFVKDGSPFRNDWIKVTTEMTEGSVPLLYNRIGKLSEAPNLIEPFTKRVEFWNSQLLLEYEKGAFLDQIPEEEPTPVKKEKEEL